ncbi:hypothetical protein VUR80DRAFT_8672 [Thermomyces stellatus]
MAAPRHASSGSSSTKARSFGFNAAYFQLRSPQNSKRAKGLASPSARRESAGAANRPGRNRSNHATRIEKHARAPRKPKNNRERLYGLLPLPGENENRVVFAKRSKGAEARQLHSTLDETKGETQREVPCLYRKRCLEVPSSAFEEVKALEETSKKACVDDDLPALYAGQTAVKEALRQAAKTAKAKAADEAKLAMKKKEHNEKRRLKAIERQAGVAMEQAEASREIAKAIVRHGEMMGKALALLQPLKVDNGGLYEECLDEDDDQDDDEYSGVYSR